MNPHSLSKHLINSLENNPQAIKTNRLEGKEFSLKEANTGKAQIWEDIEGRIKITQNQEGEHLLSDGRHLLEAYRILNKTIPNKKIVFENTTIEKYFKNLHNI